MNWTKIIRHKPFKSVCSFETMTLFVTTADWFSVILLAMLCSSKESERALAVQTISKIRSESVRANDSAKLRPFGRKEYEVSPNASELSDLNILPISDAKTEPPYTKKLV